MEKYYTVAEKPGGRITAWVCIALSALCTAFVIFTAVIIGEATPDIFLTIILALAMLAASVWLLYCRMRPRVIVSDDLLMCYPRFGKKIEIRVDEITARIANPTFDSYYNSTRISDMRTSVPGLRIRVGGYRIRYAPAPADTRGLTHILSDPRSKIGAAKGEMTILYRSDERDIITIHTGMTNAAKLDRLILSHLNKKGK